MTRKGAVGIDVSSRDFKVAILGRPGCAEFENSEEGRGKLVRFVKKHCRRTVAITLESTGVYGLDLALALVAVKRFDVFYINPRAAKGFAGLGLVRAKTDRVDAMHLAQMSQLERGMPWQPPSSTRSLCVHGRVVFAVW